MAKFHLGSGYAGPECRWSVRQLFATPWWSGLVHFVLCCDWLAIIRGHNLGLCNLNDAISICPPSHQSSCPNIKELGKLFTILPMSSRVYRPNRNNGKFNMYIYFRISFHDKYWSSVKRGYTLFIVVYCDDGSVTDDRDDSSAQPYWKLLLICHYFLIPGL